MLHTGYKEKICLALEQFRKRSMTRRMSWAVFFVLSTSQSNRPLHHLRDQRFTARFREHGLVGGYEARADHSQSAGQDVPLKPWKFRQVWAVVSRSLGRILYLGLSVVSVLHWCATRRLGIVRRGRRWCTMMRLVTINGIDGITCITISRCNEFHLTHQNHIYSIRIVPKLS